MRVRVRVRIGVRVGDRVGVRDRGRDMVKVRVRVRVRVGVRTSNTGTAGCRRWDGSAQPVDLESEWRCLGKRQGTRLGAPHVDDLALTLNRTLIQPQPSR